MSAKVLFFYITLFFTWQVSGSPSGFDLEASKARCAPAPIDEPIVYNSDFRWSYTLEEMSQRFDEIYNSGKRLDARAYYDQHTDSFYLTFRHNEELLRVKIDENFIRSVTRHIEVALENKYAEHIFFPDMGHSHLYFEESHWNKDYANIPGPAQYNEHYQKMLNDPMMRALYHTAEQLKMKEKDSAIFYSAHHEFRFWHRNPVGDNKSSDHLQIYTDPKHIANSVGELPGHHSWSSGYNISSSKNGCFSYIKDGKILYFDISLYDLPMDPSKPGDFT